MKIGKWLLGLLAGIGSILAIILGSKSNKRVKELNKKIDDSNKNVKKTKKEIKKVEKKLENKKKKAKSIKSKRNSYKKKDVGVDEASDFLKKYANKGKK
tara:strand:+ start:167 stop:463 length:297 start_codon:yes stop_codon:yes gene_type:complete